jgi:hypothetical protein
VNPSAIPFQIPDDRLVGVAGGVVRRIGTTLRDVASGRIVAHLQETSWLPRTVGVGGPAGLILAGGNLISSVAANVQLRRVRDMLVGLQMLNAATLAAAAVGVGVSAAGFALVLKRLERVEGAVAGVHRDVVAARLAAERVDVQLAAAQRALKESLLYRAEEAWARSDAADVWREVEGPLDQAQRYWRGLVGGAGAPPLFLDGRFRLEEAVAAYEAVLVLAAARVQVLLLIGQDRAALLLAEDLLGWHERVTAGLTPVDVAAARSRRLAAEEGLSEEDARARLLRSTGPAVDAMREVQLHLGDLPHLLRLLDRLGIRGRDFVIALRERDDVPLLALPAG